MIHLLIFTLSPPLPLHKTLSASLAILQTHFISLTRVSKERISSMEAMQSWVSEHKLTTIGAIWASGIGESLVAYSLTKSPMKPSLRLIHSRMHAQALTLAVLSAAAAYHYYKNRDVEPKPVADFA